MLVTLPLLKCQFNVSYTFEENHSFLILKLKSRFHADSFLTRHELVLFISTSKRSFPTDIQIVSVSLPTVKVYDIQFGFTNIIDPNGASFEANFINDDAKQRKVLTYRY